MIWSDSKSIAEPLKFKGLINVLLVVSSNSTWYDVVMPGVKDIDIRSAQLDCGSLQTTVPTTFLTNPVISGFVGVKLCGDHFKIIEK